MTFCVSREGLCLLLERHQAAACSLLSLSVSSQCFQSGTPPNLRALADVDAWGHHQRAKLRSSSHQNGDPLLRNEVFAQLGKLAVAQAEEERVSIGSR
jgi:hypothetical protein